MIPQLRWGLAWLIAAATGLTVAPPADGETVTVGDTEELVQAAQEAQPGTAILLRPGWYRGGLTFDELRGTPEDPIIIGAADPQAPPVIEGGSTGLHLVNPAHVHLRDLVLARPEFNALNIDDGGNMEATARGIRLTNLTVRGVQSEGNHDGIKLSGLRGFHIENCVIENWGGGGSGIDMVGCHEGRIVGCTLRHEGPEATSNGIQCKGGTRDVVIDRCRFDQPGHRAVNIGGSTGLRFFRPQPPPGYEAKDITVRRCTFIGSNAPVAFVGVDGATVEFNTIYRPHRWVVRILQETREPGFAPSRDGRFANNIIVYRSDELATAVNIGPHTAPESFRFAGNWWYCLDEPDAGDPDLPVPEAEGTYGRDPRLIAPERGDFRTERDSPARGVGADSPDAN